MLSFNNIFFINRRKFHLLKFITLFLSQNQLYSIINCTQHKEAFESCAPRIQSKPVWHSAPLCKSERGPVTRHALSRSSRASLAAARPIGVPTTTGQPNHRPARWHRPNQINIPPSPSGSSLPCHQPRASSFLLRHFLPSFFVRRGRAFHLLRFQWVSPIASLSCSTLRYADIPPFFFFYNSSITKPPDASSRKL